MDQVHNLIQNPHRIGMLMVTQNNIIQAEGFFPSENRWIFYRRFYSNNAPKGEIVAIHDALEHSGRYETLGIQLAKEGYNFYIFDLMGHGRSEGNRGYIHEFEDYLLDLANFYAFLKIHRNVNIPFLLGYGMGGLIATMFCSWGRCPIRGLILSDALFGFKQNIPFYKKSILHMLATILPSFRLTDLFDTNILCHDMDIITDFLTDPHIQHTVNARWLSIILKTLAKVHNVTNKILVPTLVFHGEDDRIYDIEMSKQVFTEFATRNKEFFVVKNAYHEIFNEPSRGELIEKLVNWMNACPESPKL